MPTSLTTSIEQLSTDMLCSTVTRTYILILYHSKLLYDTKSEFTVYSIEDGEKE